MPTKLSEAIDIILNALECDKRKEYKQAVRLYEDGIGLFLDALRIEIEGETASEAIIAKCRDYCDRAEELRSKINRQKLMELHRTEQHILFSDVENTEDDEKHLANAIKILARATRADKKKNYLEASRLYEQGLHHFAIVIDDAVYSDSFKEALQERKRIYDERAAKVNGYLNQNIDQQQQQQNNHT